ncbi:MAG: hypothetical protein QNJ70_25885 [Xenococcaceae cyanobacterium MO_207.B15]|nr:hypothetical protein [Xenococcaceae cyanobacterium MO_207.B15]
MNKKALISKLLKKNLVNFCIEKTCEVCGGEIEMCGREMAVKPILQSNKITLTLG